MLEVGVKSSGNKSFELGNARAIVIRHFSEFFSIFWKKLENLEFDSEEQLPTFSSLKVTRECALLLSLCRSYYFTFLGLCRWARAHAVPSSVKRSRSFRKASHHLCKVNALLSAVRMI
jgi:hypothetical protein